MTLLTASSIIKVYNGFPSKTNCCQQILGVKVMTETEDKAVIAITVKTQFIVLL